MEQPSTPIQAAQAWLAAQTPGAALAGVPAGAMLEHFLQTQAQGLPSAGHELQILEMLVDLWLKRLQSNIESFPPGAVAVLDEQKKQLLSMHKSLGELQLCLRSLRLSQAKLSRAFVPGTSGMPRPKSWHRKQFKTQEKAVALAA